MAWTAGDRGALGLRLLLSGLCLCAAQVSCVGIQVVVGAPSHFLPFFASTAQPDYRPGKLRNRSAFSQVHNRKCGGAAIGVVVGKLQSIFWALSPALVPVLSTCRKHCRSWGEGAYMIPLSGKGPLSLFGFEG